MNAGIGIYRKKAGYIKNSLLIPLAFATAFFPRILYSLGFPSFVNFFHFVIVPLACGIIIIKTKIKSFSNSHSCSFHLTSSHDC